jgi:16S rRNA (adenine(1408)-N(1))-methyltransferase
METIRGKTSRDLDLNELHERLKNYNRILLDLGTGDGRYVHSLAERFPDDFIIGVDSCRENLHEYSRVKLPNMLFIISSAQNLPCELNGLVSHISINFPWGSLLEGLLMGDAGLMRGLYSIARPNAAIDIRLNSGAMSEAGVALETGAVQVQETMRHFGWRISDPMWMKDCDLGNFPSTWSRRIAHGRDPRAISMRGCK